MCNLNNIIVLKNSSFIRNQQGGLLFSTKYVTSFDELFATECFYVQRTNLSVTPSHIHATIVRSPKIFPSPPVISAVCRGAYSVSGQILQPHRISPIIFNHPSLAPHFLELPFLFVVIKFLVKCQYSPPYTSLHFSLFMSNPVVLLPVEDQARTSSASSRRAGAPPLGGPPSYHSSSSYVPLP